VKGLRALELSCLQKQGLRIKKAPETASRLAALTRKSRGKKGENKSYCCPPGVTVKFSVIQDGGLASAAEGRRIII